MGNAISPCCQPNPNNSTVKLIFWEGTTRILRGKRPVAGEIMFEFRDHMVCHADSFFIGHPIPSLAIEDELMAGQTYFVLPLQSFPSSQLLSVSSLAALGKKSQINFAEYCPFEHIKGSNGRVLIRVSPGFFLKIISRGKKELVELTPASSFLCSTPELKKHYDQLVGSREKVWSPKLETISEYKIRFSPCRYIGLEWKQKE